MAQQRRGRAVFAPNLGLYLGVPPLMVPERGLQDCLNVRIKQQAIEKGNLGWGPFPDADTPLNLDGKPVLLIDTFVRRNDPQELIFGNTSDLFRYNSSTDSVAYLTPRYETGTVAVTNSSPTVTGTSTLWAANAKAGDFIHIGDDGETDPAAGWYQVQAVVSDTEITLTEDFDGTTASGLDYTLRQVFLGDARTAFDTETFLDAEDVEGTDGDRWYATNGVDPVVAWDGDADQVYRPNLGDLDTALFVKRFKNIMVYGRPTVSGEILTASVRTSAIGQPENVVTLEASEFSIHDGADAILAAHDLGELLVIYSERHVTLAQFVGPPLMFVFRTAVSGFGPKSSRAIAPFPDFHLFLGADAQYRFDGGRATYHNNHVFREIVRQISPQRLDLIHSFFDEENGELLWVTPLNSDADAEDGPAEQAFVHHYLEQVGENPDPHTRRQLPATAFGFFQREGTLTWEDLEDTWEETNIRWNDQFLQEAFPLVLFGDANGNVFILNSQDTQNGVIPLSFARFSRRPTGTTIRKGVVRRIYPMLEQLASASHSVTVRLRGTDVPDGNATTLVDLPFALAQATSKHFVSPRKSARYVEVEFRSNDTTGPWRLSGYDMDIVNGGER